MNNVLTEGVILSLPGAIEGSIDGSVEGSTPLGLAIGTGDGFLVDLYK